MRRRLAARYGTEAALDAQLAQAEGRENEVRLPHRLRNGTTCSGCHSNIASPVCASNMCGRCCTHPACFRHRGL